MPVTDMLLGAAEQNDQAAFDMVTVWGHSYDGQTGANAKESDQGDGFHMRLP